MYEELYIIKNGERLQLDLSTPSGISLNFKSNLFGDLSKISCSYSYTFKLPMTRRNRQIMENAEDIRQECSMVRKRLKAEFWQNGVNLFSNANLYVSETSEAYSAVLTWNVNDGLESLKEDDVNLNELVVNDSLMTSFGSGDLQSATEVFDNTANVLRPTYNCGLPYYLFKTQRGGWRGDSFIPIWTTGILAYPMPVVPVYRILQLIEARYGVKCRLGERMGMGQFKITGKEDDIITRGVIPLVGIDLSDSDLEKYGGRLMNCHVHNTEETSMELPIKCILTFDNIELRTGSNSASSSETNEYFGRSKTILYQDDNYITGTIFENTGVCPKMDNMTFEYDGCIIANVAEQIGDDVPTLSVYQLQNEYVTVTGGARGTVGRRNHYVWKEITSVEGEHVSGTEYRFDFASANGCERLECSNTQNGQPLSFQFNYHMANGRLEVPITVHLMNNDGCVTSRPISLFHNLPDISCQTFIKSLFFMIGAYPVPNEYGELVPHFFSDIKRNLELGNVIDWSDKDMTLANEQPDSIKFELSEFAQNNYYLMKSDNLEKMEKDAKEEKDVYADGTGRLVVESEVIDRTKTIIQIPFYAPYIKNKKSAA